MVVSSHLFDCRLELLIFCMVDSLFGPSFCSFLSLTEWLQVNCVPIPDSLTISMEDQRRRCQGYTYESKDGDPPANPSCRKRPGAASGTMPPTIERKSAPPATADAAYFSKASI